MPKSIINSKKTAIIRHGKLRAPKQKTDSQFAAIPAAMPRHWHPMTQITPQLISVLKPH